MQEDNDPEKWTKGLSSLIADYEKSSGTKLDGEVEHLDGITYGEILTRLRELRHNVDLSGGQEPEPGVLEQVMIKWLKDVAPEKVNERTLGAIHKFACCIYGRIEEQKPRPREKK